MFFFFETIAKKDSEYLQDKPKSSSQSSNEETYKGIVIKGASSHRRYVKQFIDKYHNRPDIGEVIKTRLKEVDISEEKLTHHGKPTSATAYLGKENKGRIKFATTITNNQDRFEWIFGHELGHLKGWFGREGERKCDAYANKHIYNRPKYCYTEKALSEIPEKGYISLAQG